MLYLKMTLLKMKNSNVLSGSFQNKVLQLFFLFLLIWKGEIVCPKKLALSEMF